MQVRGNIAESNHTLVITADNEARKELGEIYRQNDGGYYKAESFIGEGLHEKFDFILPEQIGALTDSPLLINSDGYERKDDGSIELLNNARVFFFNFYALKDPWQSLRDTGKVVFNEAPVFEPDPLINVKSVEIPYISTSEDVVSINTKQKIKPVV